MHNSQLAHLHNHSYFSTLDGLASPEQYAQRASKMGFKHLGLTDHGSVSGLIQHQQACEKYGIHPVLGCEGYIVPNMHVKEKGSKNAHINFFVQNAKGWATLMKLMTTANNVGFYYRPRMDFDLLLNTDLEGLFVTTACAGSFITIDGGMDFFWKIYNKIGENLLLEIMPHRIESQERVHTLLDRMIAKDSSLLSQIICTNDCHYALKEDALAQEVLLAINSRKKWDDPKRFSFGFDGLHLRSASEMQFEFKLQNHFDADVVKNGIKNTLNIANMCEFIIPKSDICLPIVASVPKSKTEEEFIYELALEGYENIFGKELEDGVYKERLDFEFDLLKKKGFLRYFLLVWDLLKHCRENDIPYGPGRGSAASSLLAYLIGITKVDPLEHGLFFERFIAQDRCLVGDTKIVTKDGLKEIRNIKSGDVTINRNGDFDTIEKVGKRHVKEKLLKIYFNDSYVVCTKDHKWIVLDENNKEVDKRAKDIDILKDRLIRLMLVKEGVKIKKIEEIEFEGKVYSLKVKNNPSYCIEGNILSRNSDYPDIDIDFGDIKRYKIKEYLEKTYGSNRICSIPTFIKIKDRGAIRDVCRVFDVPEKEVDEFSKSIWKDDTIKSATIKTSTGRDFYRKYRKEVDLAIKLDGTVKAMGRHAAALVVSGEDLTKTDKTCLKTVSGMATSCWSMSDAEHCGLMKLDVLALNTLTVIDEAEKLIGNGFSVDSIPYGDKDVFDMLNSCKLAGVFQMSSHTFVDYVSKLGVSDFNDIVASLALVRPGPLNSGMSDDYINRKHGFVWDKSHPIYEEITKETYGVCVYQEQMLQIISRLAGLPFAVADKIRKVIGKKRDAAEFKPFKLLFVEGCAKEKTFTPKEAENFWNGLLEWAQYGFSKAHSVAYAKIAYQTAWLKYHYTTEFISAHLSYANEKIDLVNEAKGLGYKFIPPKIGISDSVKWVAHGDNIYAPFIAIVGVGDKAANIVARPVNSFNFGFFKKETPRSKGKLESTLREIGAYDKYDVPYHINNYMETKIF